MPQYGSSFYPSYPTSTGAPTAPQLSPKTTTYTPSYPQGTQQYNPQVTQPYLPQGYQPYTGTNAVQPPTAPPPYGTYGAPPPYQGYNPQQSYNNQYRK